MDWDFIDKTFVMSTEERPAICQHLSGIGLKHEVVVFPRVGKDNNVSGEDLTLWDILCHHRTDHVSNRIAQNHITLVQKALSNNSKNVLIMEDDARFELPLPVEKLDRIQAWLSDNEYDLFYFGHCPWPLLFSFLLTRDIVRITSPYTCHAYIVSRSGMHKILSHVQDRDISQLNVHYDRLLNEIPLQKYGVFPSINFQNKEPALYREGIQRLLPSFSYVPFRFMVRSLETVSIVLPLLVIFFCCYSVLRLLSALP